MDRIQIGFDGGFIGMKYLVSANAHSDYPAELFFGILKDNADLVMELPLKYTFASEWGMPESHWFEEPRDRNIPSCIDLVYLSLREKQFYSLESSLDASAIEETMELLAQDGGTPELPCLTVGLGAGGLVAIWVYGNKKSKLISVLHAVPANVPMKAFRPFAPDTSLDELCEKYFNPHKTDVLSAVFAFMKKMQQFMYRYVLLCEDSADSLQNNENEPGFEIFESLTDGSFDKTADGRLMNYRMAGKPSKIALHWTRGKTVFAAYFWLEEEAMAKIFERFYGAHPDSKTDFIFRIDPEKKKYELFLFRQGLKEPIVIPEQAYQLVVFKNKFEDYRSGNYDQARGAWVW